MAELGIIPDAPGAEGYLELGATGQGRVFRKHLLTINKQFLHPRTGRPITLGEREWQQLKSNFDSKRIIQAVTFPLADSQNRHTEDPLAVAGIVSALERDGDRVMATIDVKDAAVAERIADGRLPGASAFLALDAKDPATGERAGAALLHVCGTLRPALADLSPYESVVAACGPAWTALPDGSQVPPTALLLCQSEIDPPGVMLADPDYVDDLPDCQVRRDDDGGTAGMDEDYLRDEAARLGLLAYQESIPGRGSKPEYPVVITDRDRAAALSAENEVTDTEITEATRELADRYQVSFSAVSCLLHDSHIRSGLGHSIPERAAVVGEVQVALSRGQLELDDEQVLKLAGRVQGGEDEVLRLTSDERDEDMFVSFAHPSKSGKLVTTRGRNRRAHASDLDEDATDTDQPARGGDVHAKIRELIEDNPDLFSDGQGRAFPQHESHPPLSPAQRERDEVRARAGHGASTPIPGLAAGSARMSPRDRLRAQIRARGPLSPYEK